MQKLDKETRIKRPYPRMRIKNRHKNRIIYDVLVFVSNNKNSAQTKIMYGAYLSTTQLDYYLSVMLESKLLEFNPATKRYNVTSKAADYIKRYSVLAEMINDELQD